MLSNKQQRILGIIVYLILALAGVATIIFSIFNLAGNHDIPSLSLLTLVLGIFSIVLGAYKLVIAYIDGKDDLEINDVAIGGLLVGFGVFLVIPASDTVINQVVSKGLTLLIAGVGLAFLIKAIIALANKQDRTSSWLLLLVGALGLGLGLLFFFLEGSVTVLWLITGILVTIFSIITLVRIFLSKEE